MNVVDATGYRPLLNDSAVEHDVGFFRVIRPCSRNDERTQRDTAPT